MMKATLRKSAERGLADHGWLKSFHTFSFADYYDPEHMGFHSLRVINEDRVQPGQGFGTHPHQDMEIISYVLAGALAHKDSMGNGSTIRPGDVQRMSAGTGVRHSEFNDSKSEAVHFFQIWILPAKNGLPPGYEQKHFTAEDRAGRLRLVASPDGSEGSVSLNQDARLYASLLAKGQVVTHSIRPGRAAWIQMASGKVEVAGAVVGAGDAVAFDEPGWLEISCTEECEFLLFDII